MFVPIVSRMNDLNRLQPSIYEKEIGEEPQTEDFDVIRHLLRTQGDKWFSFAFVLGKTILFGGQFNSFHEAEEQIEYFDGKEAIN